LVLLSRLVDLRAHPLYRPGMDRRRLLLTALAGALAGPLIAEAQPSKKVRIGYLSSNPPSDTEDAIAAFRTKLRDRGYIDWQNLLIGSRYAEGRYERVPQLAADLGPAGSRSRSVTGSRDFPDKVEAAGRRRVRGRVRRC
jgi:hypothetical protein